MSMRSLKRKKSSGRIEELADKYIYRNIAPETDAPEELPEAA